jgi:peptidoglycan/xylan/chitin deacetylase (PgdA/CDA1 family)
MAGKPGTAENHRLAVALTFDFDAESVFIGMFGDIGKGMVSRGTYGPRQGVPRILKLLEKYNLPATFFIPGQDADAHPDVVRSIAKAGHEIAHHTYTHRPAAMLTPEEEEEEFVKGIETLERLAGQRPRGYRAGGIGLSDVTRALLLKYEFEYDGAEHAADRPYWMEYKGKRTNIVELPCQAPLVDSGYLWFFYPPIYCAGLSEPSKIEEIWREEFEGAYEEGGDIYFDLTIHPCLSGRHHRIQMLERFFVFMMEHDGVWFAHMREIAAEFRRRQGSA